MIDHEVVSLFLLLYNGLKVNRKIEKYSKSSLKVYKYSIIYEHSGKETKVKKCYTQNRVEEK